MHHCFENNAIVIVLVVAACMSHFDMKEDFLYTILFSFAPLFVCTPLCARAHSLPGAGLDMQSSDLWLDTAFKRKAKNR